MLIEKMKQYLKIAKDVESQKYTIEVSYAKLEAELKRIRSTKYYDDVDCTLNEITYNVESVDSYVKEHYTGFYKSLFTFKLFKNPIFNIAVMLLLFSFSAQSFLYGGGLLSQLFGDEFKWTNVFFFGALTWITLLFIIGMVYKRIKVSHLKSNFANEKSRHNALRQKSEKLLAENQVAIKVCEVNMEALNKQYKELTEFRNNFYSDNCLPEPYRNLPATTTMYQWIDFGICTEIYGHGGLFDRYDYSLKIGEIVNNLQQINAKMNVVIRNQQLLLKEVRNGNEIAGKILNYVKSIDKTNTQMAHDISQIKASSEITAINSARQTMYAEYQYYSSY